MLLVIRIVILWKELRQIAYFSLIDIHKYEKQISHDFHAEWFSLEKNPSLIFYYKQYFNGKRKTKV